VATAEEDRLNIRGTHPVKAAETVIGSDFDCD
jgi:hypothetical protein